MRAKLRDLEGRKEELEKSQSQALRELNEKQRAQEQEILKASQQAEKEGALNAQRVEFLERENRQIAERA